MTHKLILLFAAGAMALTPSAALAGPRLHAPTTGQGTGWDHLNSGKAVGQPNESCEEAGVTPGRAGSAPGEGSPFTGEDSTSGIHYAGSQPQNSRNTASVSQYDTACANQL